MKIAYFEKSLLEHLGDAARGSFEVLGLSNTEIRQMQDPQGNTVSFIGIMDEETFDSSKCTKVMTVEEANAKITQLYVPEYFVKSEAIFNASLTAKIADGSVELVTLDESVTMSDQYKWFHDHGVKGIGVSVPPAPFALE